MAARRGSSATTSAARATLCGNLSALLVSSRRRENLTGRENLWMFGRLQGLSSKKAHSVGDDLLAQFDLAQAAHRPISQFSGGMRRRLDLAASLITRPALLFLESPRPVSTPGTAARCGTRSAAWSPRDRPSC